MSLSALVVYKILSDLPRERTEAVVALLLPAVVGFVAAGQAYAASRWLGLAYLVVSSAFVSIAAVIAVSSYVETGEVRLPVTRS